MSSLPDGMLSDTFEYLIAFTTAHEGATNFMYNNWPLKNAQHDVTVGVGLAVVSETDAASAQVRSLFTVKATGLPASADDMRAEFRRVDNLPRTAKNLLSDYRDKSPLTIDDATMMRVLRERMLGFWDSRGEIFANFGSIPAQAQVALMSWNYGLRLRGAPNMCKAVRAGDYPRAAAECYIRDWDEQKNIGHKTLLLNASTLVHEGKDLTKLPPIKGPFKPPPSEMSGSGTLNTVPQQLAGKWTVAIGDWKGLFFFDANGGISWTDTEYGRRHAGRWQATNTSVDWKFRDPGDIRTFTVALPLDTAGDVAGTILPAGQGWFNMSKVDTAAR